MSNDWQNSLLFLEDEHKKITEPGPTGKFIFRSMGARFNLIAMDLTAEHGGANVRDNDVVERVIAGQTLDPGPVAPVDKIQIRLSAEYNGYYPVDLDGIEFPEIPRAEMYRNARKQARDCALWRDKFNLLQPLASANKAHFSIALVDEDGAYIREPNTGDPGHAYFTTLDSSNISNLWFTNEDESRYQRTLVPGEKIYFRIEIVPPSSTDYEILAADSFHIRFNILFREQTPHLMALRSDEAFEICVPIAEE